MSVTSAVSAPRATVRLQIHAGFDLDAAAARVPYYAALGISHYYVSPLQSAKAGSEHGYDGIDPARIDAGRGGRAGLRRLVAVLRSHGMGLILDIVPNHLSSSLENRWWYDVLEFGRDSAYASFFAIDWQPAEAALQDRVLAPFLGDTPAALMERGALRLGWDEGDDRLVIDAEGQCYPMRASLYAAFVEDALPALDHAFAAALDHAGFAEARVLLGQALADPSARSRWDAAIERINADPVSLKRCLREQVHELTCWTDASTRINWRRFFDIGELVALRSEDEAVFEACHALVFELYAAGEIDGVRVDHIDGLADPRSYLKRLRDRFTELETLRPDDACRGPAWIVVEKILASAETLKRDWPIDGSTGYEFMDQVGALLHDAAAAAPLERLWMSLGGAAYETIALDAKRSVLGEAFGADFDRVLRRAIDACPDVARAQLASILEALLIHYPRYRGYASAGSPDADDSDALASATFHARAVAGIDAAALADVLDVLAGRRQDATAALAVTAFQQLTAPLTARALEDTAFYRYSRLLSRNEVGSDPARFALAVADFHGICAARARDWPHTLLATASHDHKRGADTRLRIAAIGDDVAAWTRWTASCVTADDRHVTDGDERPDRMDRYALEQIIAGIWPAQAPSPAEREQLIARITAWAMKATRERKVHGSWATPDSSYEAAFSDYIDQRLRDGSSAPDPLGLIRTLAPSAAVRGLTQLTLRCTTPGIPDLFEGSEFWDDSLVDPDNRRAFDYEARQSALASEASDSELFSRWCDGHIKQRLLFRLLRLRREFPQAMSGTHRGVQVVGQLSEHFIAFTRRGGGRTVLVIATLRPATLVCPHSLKLDAGRLREATLDLPACTGRDAISGRALSLSASPSLADILDEWPCAAVILD